MYFWIILAAVLVLGNRQRIAPAVYGVVSKITGHRR